jgi:hypothetical protein
MKKSLACKSCGGKTKMKDGGEKPKKSFAEKRNSRAVAQGYESLADKKAKKQETKNNKAQNATMWSGVGSSILGSVLLAKEALKKEKRGGTTKRKTKR